MTIYTNRAVVGPDGRFVDANSEIPDGWATGWPEWVDDALKCGSFVDGEPRVVESPAPPVIADVEAQVNAGRKVEAKQ